MATAPASMEGRDGEAPWQNMTKIFESRTGADKAAHLVPHLEPTFRILDVGCGLGSIAVDLADLVPDGEVIGIDTNPTSTVTAQDNARKRKYPNVSFRVGDAYDLSEFSDDSFDVVHAHQVMLHLVSPVKALQEMRRILKPGGILSLRDNIELFHYPHDQWMKKQRDYFVTYARRAGAEERGGLYHHDWAYQAGFDWQRIVAAPVAKEYPGEETRRMWAEGAKTSFRAVALKAGLGTEEEHDRIAEAWSAWAEKDEARLMSLDGTLLAWK